MTHRHGSLSVGSCAFEKMVVAFGVGSTECAPFSICIAGAHFVIKMGLNGVLPGEKEVTERLMF